MKQGSPAIELRSNTWGLLPRAMIDVEGRSIAATFFGRRWDAPFGIAPIGMGNLIWPGADAMVAAAARDANIPYVLSTAGTTSMEVIASIAPEHAWFQLYVGKSQVIVDDLISRADRAGFEVLVVTVDVPAPGRRLRDQRNGLRLPLRPSAVWGIELATHPVWSLATLRKGPPRFANLEPYAASNASACVAGHADGGAELGAIGPKPFERDPSQVAPPSCDQGHPVAAGRHDRA